MSESSSGRIPALGVTGLGKRLGHRHVLRDLAFQVAEGEFVLLLGNNGAGKTTLIRIVSALMRPSEGELRFRGRSYAEVATELRQAMGVIAHDSRLYGDLTAWENLRLFATLYGVTGLKEKIGPALEQVRLDHVPDVPVRTFSSGMLKRLTLARLLLYRPSLLLLDEPYSGLDQSSVELLDAYLAGFKQQGGTTLLTTHQFTRGVALADRILVLHHGRLVYNRPETGVAPERCAQLLNRIAAGLPAEGEAPAAVS